MAKPLTREIDLVVKFGGSAITDKSKLETINQEALNQAAELIRLCLDNRLSCVVVHGAGSFGHFQAKEYNVAVGWSELKDDETKVKDVKKGFCVTRTSVTMLNHKVVSELLNHNVPAVGLSATGTWKMDNRKVVRADLESVADMLRDGFVPVLHGDCVLDTTRGCAILSGDIIIQKLTEEFRVGRVVFLTSVNGVYDKPPHLPGAHLLETILVTDAEKSTSLVEPNTEQSTQADTPDVTGGMTLKIETAVNIVRNTRGETKIFICKIGTPYAMDVCLYGKLLKQTVNCGTEIVFN